MSDEEQHQEGERPLCEECGENRATVHLTEFLDGQPVLRHLCEDCYAQKGGGLGLSPMAAFAHILAAVAPQLRQLSDTECPRCGATYLDFQQRGVLGCPQGYEVFEAGLAQLLEQIHGASQHCGKLPPQADEKARGRCELEGARHRLALAVEQENYELAARLRDRISELESEQDEPGES